MATQPHPAPPPPPRDQYEIRIVSHSNLFYWWPLWAFGFVLGCLSLVEGKNMAIVPKGAVIAEHASLRVGDQDYSDREVLVMPKDAHLGEPYLKVAENKSYGVVFTFLLLLLIVITNVPLRGLWSVVVIVVLVMLSIILSVGHWWEPILESLGRLHIHMNAGGYFLISLGLFAIWAVTILLFDPQIYMVFTPGQLRVRQEIGGGEAVYDTAGMMVQKQRNDLFRHWVLGLGSGDMIVTTSGASTHHIDLPNVLFIGYKLRQIEDMLREKPVVQG